MSFSLDPRRPTRLAFHPSRIVIDVGVLLVLGAMSLPFVTAEGFRQRAVAGDGLIALLLVLPVFLMTLLPDHSAPLRPPLAWAAAALAAIALPYTVVKYLDASALAGALQGSVGTGARVLVMGAFTVLAGVGLGLVRALLGPPPSASMATGADGPSAAVSRIRRTSSPRAGSGRQGPASPPSGEPAAAAGTKAALTPSPAGFRRRRRSPRPQPEPVAASPGRPDVPEDSRPSARVAPRPRSADPTTEPTLPAQRPVQPWWPDDLDDLFS